MAGKCSLWDNAFTFNKNLPCQQFCVCRVLIFFIAIKIVCTITKEAVQTVSYYIFSAKVHATVFQVNDIRIFSVDEKITFPISKLGKSLTGVLKGRNVSWRASNTALRLGGSVGPCQQSRIGKVRNHDSQFDFRRRARWLNQTSGPDSVWFHPKSFLL